MLRRQMIRPARKPLIALTPKSLLRHNLAVSTLEELCEGEFRAVIDEIDELNSKKVNRLVLCSGKVYYDLLEARREAQSENVAIVRLEQLYPFPESALAELLVRYGKLKTAVWCQEEPMNQGAWYSSQHHIRKVLQQHLPQLPLDYVGREAFAAPAAGSPGLHIEQQQQLVNEALFGNTHA
jgi:2-oxoglutarate dehydrogenase E1 component